MDIISNYMIATYLNCLLKAATPLRVSSSRQWQAAANFDVSPNHSLVAVSLQKIYEIAILMLSVFRPKYLAVVKKYYSVNIDGGNLLV